MQIFFVLQERVNLHTMSCSHGRVFNAANMDTSRRHFLTGFLGTAASACFGQGVATRKAAVQPRGKSSGLPFEARFQDVTARAGLRHVTVYGGVDRKDYIIDVTGCGCAFLDYDNDGLLDVFVLSGVRLSDTPKVRAIAYIRTTATAHSQTSPRNRGCSKRAGPAECVSVTITTTVSKICSSPTGDITFSTVTMAMAPFQT